MDSNNSAYESSKVISAYAGNNLGPDEARILLRYYDLFRVGSVLDVGCGAGRLSRYLLDICNDYIGLDLSSGMVEYCRTHYEDGTFYVCDMRNMEIIPSDSISLATIFFNSLDYVDHEGRMETLIEIRRILKPRGILIFSSHNLNRDVLDYSSPRLSLSRNPVRWKKEVSRYFLEKKNWDSTLASQKECTQYSLLNDGAHQYQLLTYHTTKENQSDQLRLIGFDVLALYDRFGNTLNEGDVDTKSQWINYVCCLGSKVK